MHINNIPSDAPLFEGASETDLQAIMDGLRKASYHYADDSGSEWGSAKKAVKESAELANKCKLGYLALFHLHTEVGSLVGIDKFFDAVLKAAREGARD